MFCASDQSVLLVTRCGLAERWSPERTIFAALNKCLAYPASQSALSGKGHSHAATLELTCVFAIRLDACAHPLVGRKADHEKPVSGNQWSRHWIGPGEYPRHKERCQALQAAPLLLNDKPPTCIGQPIHDLPRSDWSAAVAQISQSPEKPLGIIRMSLFTSLMSVRPHRPIDMSSSLWITFRASVTPCWPLAPRP